MPSNVPDTAPGETLSMILYSVPTTGLPSSEALSVASASETESPATSRS